MGNRGLQINPVGVLASCGLGLNLVWCTLMGHTLGFMSSTAGMDAWANPRLFFLAGILLCTAAFATAPRALKRADGMLRFVLPLLSAFGTEFAVVSAGGCSTMVPVDVPAAFATL